MRFERGLDRPPSRRQIIMGTNTRAYMREWRQKQRARLRAEGKCYNCNTPVVPGLKTCASHRRKPKPCWECDQPPIAGSRLCKPHHDARKRRRMDHVSEQNRQSYYERKLLGRCVYHGCPRKIVTETMCAEHRDTNALRIQQSRERRIAAGLCPGCGKVPTLGFVQCAEHRARGWPRPQG